MTFPSEGEWSQDEWNEMLWRIYGLEPDNGEFESSFVGEMHDDEPDEDTISMCPQCSKGILWTVDERQLSGEWQTFKVCDCCDYRQPV